MVVDFGDFDLDFLIDIEYVFDVFDMFVIGEFVYFVDV